VSERRHPTSRVIPDAKDHRGWIDHWLRELNLSIASYVMTGASPALDHAVRSARMLHWHAVKWKPALVPPRGY
jgi:hypothetical protein